MLTHTLEPSGKPAKLVFNKVGENLYRLDSSGTYYALLKRAGKQFRRSLKTTDRKLADRRLADLRSKIGTLAITEDAKLSFEEVAQRWLDTSRHALKASSVKRRETCIKNLTPFFKGVAIRNVAMRDCERWVVERGSTVAPQTFAHELNTMRATLDYALKQGLILTNPALAIKRRKVVQARIVVPTREQFQRLVAAMRDSDGRTDSQSKAKAGADLVEFLAYSGCRLAEATGVRWRDVNFETKVMTVTGGEVGTKNMEIRTVPLTPALQHFLKGLITKDKPHGDSRIIQIQSAKTCLRNTCRRLSFPDFTHHDFRHFFATTCIESGVDIPTISRWLGHKDGGALAMRVYGHLRDAHSLEMAGKVSFGIA